MGNADSLKEWIRSEMTMEKAEILFQVKDRVSRLLGVSSDGGVGFKLTGEQTARLSSSDKILLFMIGKLYAQAGGYTDDDSATNPELQVSLGMPEGTVRAELTSLRKSRLVNAIRPGVHSIARNRVLEVLENIETRVG